MTLSIIIVNYNVKYFLEQCLFSIKRASEGLLVETIVVDNNSTDNSLTYLQPKFPEVQFIKNEANLGFAKACNKGLQKAFGKYVLFLNPDTLLSEDSLHKSIRFLENTENAGAVGVQMIDGSGEFLRESKRAFPSPLTSLYKLFGLSGIFPRSKTFGRYHLGHLDHEKTHEVDVLAGAFMMVKKEVLQKLGAFDENFFMYGEDIDLSYRIQKGGWKNYYLADTSIIHFKGESTKRGSLNYVRLFYSAMHLFVEKHYGGTKARIFTFSIQLAIWIRAAIAAIAKFINWVGLPLVDALLILLSFLLVKEIWVTYVKPDYHYSDELIRIAFPSFTIVYLIAAYYAGLYDKDYHRKKLRRSTAIATVILLVLYGLLPEQYRFSRGIVLFGALLAFVFISLFRWILLQSKFLKEEAGIILQPYILIAGTSKEFEEVKSILIQQKLHNAIIGRIAIDDGDKDSIAHLKNIKNLSGSLKVKELVVCIGRLSFGEAVALTKEINGKAFLQFHAAGSESIVGSNSGDEAGYAFSTERPLNLSKHTNRKIKRLIDVAIALLAILIFPFTFFIFKQPFNFLQNGIDVIAGNKTWVGYNIHQSNLPGLRSGIIPSNGVQQYLPVENLIMIDYWYARDYDPVEDVKTILKNYKHLDA